MSESWILLISSSCCFSFIGTIPCWHVKAFFLWSFLVVSCSFVFRSRCNHHHPGKLALALCRFKILLVICSWVDVVRRDKGQNDRSFRKLALGKTSKFFPSKIPKTDWHNVIYKFLDIQIALKSCRSHLWWERKNSPYASKFEGGRHMVDRKQLGVADMYADETCVNVQQTLCEVLKILQISELNSYQF